MSCIDPRLSYVSVSPKLHRETGVDGIVSLLAFYFFQVLRGEVGFKALKGSSINFIPQLVKES